MDGEILITKRVEELPPNRLMDKIVLTFTVLGKPVKIHIEFKEPICIEEMPRTVLEAPEENLLEELESQIWVYKNKIDKIDEVAGVEEQEEQEEDDE